MMMHAHNIANNRENETDARDSEEYGSERYEDVKPILRRSMGIERN